MLVARYLLSEAGTVDRTKGASVAARAQSATVATAMHAVNAIEPLCRAEPGIKTFLNLPLITGAHAGAMTQVVK
jgi:hypothetical protein